MQHALKLCKKLHPADVGADIIRPAHPQTSFDEAELGDPFDYIRAKHTKDFEKFVKEELPDGRIVYTFNNGTVCYIYEFTEI